MGQLGLPEIIVILLIVIMLFGVKKIPEIGSALGKAIREFKKAGQNTGDEDKNSIERKNHDVKS